jgi:hypothetical protein
MKMRTGDRVRVHRTDEAGMAVFVYGYLDRVDHEKDYAFVFVDDELRASHCPLRDVQPVQITTVEVRFDSSELCLALAHNPPLRRGLVFMWQAEAELAGIELDRLEPLGDDGNGLDDHVDSWALAVLEAGGETFWLRMWAQVPTPSAPDGLVRVCAEPQHWDS